MNKFKKTLIFTLSCCLVLGTMIFASSCNNVQQTCTSHTDADADGKCDVCEADVASEESSESTEQTEQSCTAHADADLDGKCDTCTEDVPLPENVDITVVVKDQDGAVVEGVAVTFLRGTTEISSATTDAEGKANATVPEGECTVRFDSFPTGYYASSTAKITASKDAPTTELEIINNIPNGTKDRPFVFTQEDCEIEIPAGATYQCVIHGTSRTLTIVDADTEVTYGEQTYTPDGDGKIELMLIAGDGMRDPIYFALTNKSADTKTLQLKFESLPGSIENPYAVTELDAAITAEAPKDSSVYYRWVATGDGVLMVSSYTKKNNIMLYNTKTMAVSSYTDGGICEYIYVNEGDTVSVVVASNSTQSVNSVEFSLSFFEATEADPILLLEDSSAFRLGAGVTYYFVCEEGRTLSVSGDVEVTCGGETVSPDSEYSLEADEIFSISNNGEDKAEIVIKLKAVSEE